MRWRCWLVLWLWSFCNIDQINTLYTLKLHSYIIFIYKAVKKYILIINIFVEILCEVVERYCSNYWCLVQSHSGEEIEAHREVGPCWVTLGFKINYLDPTSKD